MRAYFQNCFDISFIFLTFQICVSYFNYFPNVLRSEAREGSEPEEVEDEQEPEGDSLRGSEEEYDSEEESDDGRDRKRMRKDRFRDFIIDEAEVNYQNYSCMCLSLFSNVKFLQVDDECEDEDECEDGEQEIGIVANEVDEIGPTARDIDGRRRAHNIWE